MTRMLKIFMTGLVALSLLGGTSALAAENLVVNGSTTVLPIGQATAEAFMKKNPNVNISISGGGSGNGIKALIDKTTQIAMSSRQMKKEEIELAKSKGVNPVEHKVAIDALTPVVHPINPVKDLIHRAALPHLPGQDPQLEGSGRQGHADRRRYPATRAPAPTRAGRRRSSTRRR